MFSIFDFINGPDAKTTEKKMNIFLDDIDKVIYSDGIWNAVIKYNIFCILGFRNGASSKKKQMEEILPFCKFDQIRYSDRSDVKIEDHKPIQRTWFILWVKDHFFQKVWILENTNGTSCTKHGITCFQNFSKDHFVFSIKSLQKGSC